jgi:leucyl aminopeptidase
VTAAYIRALGNHEGTFDQPASSAVDALAKLGSDSREAVPALAIAPNISDHLKKEIADALRRIR